MEGKMRSWVGKLTAGAVSLLAASVVLGPGAAVSAPFDLYVGYSDGLRGTGFFPNPWNGDPGITFLGGTAPFDAGAIMIVNTSATALTINSVGVTINGTTLGAGYAPAVWAASFPLTIGAGAALILTQTTQYNFDTSDISFIPGATYGNLAMGCTPTCPTVTIGWDGSALQTFLDSTHTLDTGGFDFASNGRNEAFKWRFGGGCSGPGCGG
jgi:hypothetical protein